MVHEQKNENNYIPEEGDSYVDARKLEKNKIVDGAKIETHKLAAGLEESDKDFDAHAFFDGPEKSGPNKNSDNQNDSFGRPLNTHKYSHFGQKILARWENVGIANIPVASASFILATTGAIVDVARRVPGDVLSLALHPVSAYQNAKSAWDNGMDSEETSIS